MNIYESMELLEEEDVKKDMCLTKIRNEYYKFLDGWFTYFVNKYTGEKKIRLDEDDILID